jgi:hypothetical protein
MPSFSQDNVKIAVARKVPNADIGRRLGSTLQQELAIKMWEL